MPDKFAPEPEKMFVSWQEGDEKGKAKAFAEAAHEPFVRKAYAAGLETHHRHTPEHRHHPRLRDEVDRPFCHRMSQLACLRAYKKFGIVRNIHDTMTDFATQGIGLIHPNPRIQQFYQEWFFKVEGPDRSERMALMLLLVAACPVERITARLREKDAEDLRKGRAAQEVPVDPPVRMGKRQIPYRYVIHKPSNLELIEPELAPFLGPSAFEYRTRIPASVCKRVRYPKNDDDRRLIGKLLPSVAAAIKKGAVTIPLDPQAMRVMHYKRFDWESWAVPITESLLDDLDMLSKLKAADRTALDGCISHVRLWKLGSLENRLLPTNAAIAKLAETLAHVGNGGAFDLIWGPDIELKETSTDIHRFLGEAKYAPHLNAIYAGYGIPPTLTGAATSGGFTNNFISLKTMTERLAYVRQIVQKFWEYEIALVQQAMGFRLPATVRFDRMVLTDEAAEKNLLIQLADRGLISVETLQERFREDPMIEEVRQRTEAKKRKSGKLPPQSGPWYDPQADQKLKSQFVQQGGVAPSQVGIDLPPKKPGEETPAQHQAKVAPKPVQDPKLRGQPQKGRPKNSKDSQKRKKKRVLVRTKAALIESLTWAEDAQRAVAEVTTPAYLKSLNKKTLRQLTTAEGEEFERFKFALLVSLPAGKPVDAKLVMVASASPLSVPPAIDALLKATVEKYEAVNGQAPVEKVREFQRKVVALHAFEDPQTGE